jgi:hypothetical protein
MNQEDKQVSVRAAVEQAWRDRVKAQGIPLKGQKYIKAEIEFFCGAMVAINAMDPNAEPDRLSRLVPPAWVILPMSGRPIVENHIGS